MREHEGVYVQTHVNENLAEIELAKELYAADSYLGIYERRTAPLGTIYRYIYIYIY